MEIVLSNVIDLKFAVYGGYYGCEIIPALFSISVDPIAKKIYSEFNIWYLGDATKGGTEEAVLNNLKVTENYIFLFKFFFLSHLRITLLYNRIKKWRIVG